MEDPCSPCSPERYAYMEFGTDFQPRTTCKVYKRRRRPARPPTPPPVRDFKVTTDLPSAWDCFNETAQGFLPSQPQASYQYENTAGYPFDENRIALSDFYPKGYSEFKHERYRRDRYPQHHQLCMDQRQKGRFPFQEIRNPVRRELRQEMIEAEYCSDPVWGQRPLGHCAWDMNPQSFEPMTQPKYWTKYVEPEQFYPRRVRNFQAEPGRNVAWECFEPWHSGWVPSDEHGYYPGDERDPRDNEPLHKYYERRPRTQSAESSHYLFNWDEYDDNQWMNLMSKQNC